jgi:hypothetical protein
VDALISLDSDPEQTKVFIRATSNPLRERFTMAHELAHLLLPWHLPRRDCHVGDGDFEVDSRGITSETEADIFASCVLLPDRWFATLLADHGDDMSAILNQMNSAEISVPAGMLALRRYLLAGWVFHRTRTNWTLATVGTRLERTPTLLTLAELARAATSSGTTRLNDEEIRWYCFLPEVSRLPERASSDSRTANEVLVSAASLGRDARSAQKVGMSANGKVGGILREADGRPALELYRTLLYRLEDWDHADLLNNDDFLLWLAEKARSISARATSGRRSSSRASR